MGVAFSTVGYQVVSSPVTSVSIAALIWIWVQLFLARSDGKAYAAGYNDCVIRQQWWRALSAPFVNTSFPLLLLNVITLWSCRFLEQSYGSWFYFRYSIVLAVAETVFSVGALHTLFTITRSRPGSHRENMTAAARALASSQWQGSTGVILSWLAYQSVSFTVTIDHPFFFLGLFPIPWAFAVLLFIFSSPLLSAGQQRGTSGLFCGYLLALGILAILPDLYWSICFLLNIAIFLLSKGLVRAAAISAAPATPSSSSSSSTAAVGGGDGEIIELPSYPIPAADSEVIGDIEMGNMNNNNSSLSAAEFQNSAATSSSAITIDADRAARSRSSSSTVTNNSNNNSGLAARMWSSARGLTNSIGAAAAVAATAATTTTSAAVTAEARLQRGGYAPVTTSNPAGEQDGYEGEEGQFEAARPSLRSRSRSPINSSNQLNDLI